MLFLLHASFLSHGSGPRSVACVLVWGPPSCEKEDICNENRIYFLVNRKQINVTVSECDPSGLLFPKQINTGFC